MSSRRNFLKSAGLLAGAAIPVTGWGRSDRPALDDFVQGSDDELSAGVRRQLLIPEHRVYLNTGSLGPSPSPVVEIVTDTMHQLESNPVQQNWGPLGNQMEEVRKKVATFIHALPEDVLLTRNTTEGLSLIAQSLDLKTGDEMLTTTREHDGALVGLQFAEKTKGAILKRVDLAMPATSVEEVVAAIKKALTPKTRVLLLSHINTISGMVMPFAEISRITRARNIWLIADGAQAPGLIPVDVAALGVDAYAASGHKWLMGPKETGFLWTSPRIRTHLKSMFMFSGMQAYTASSGTRNVATVIGLGAAIEYHTRLGGDRVHQYTLQLRNYCMQELRKLKGVTVLSPEAYPLSCGIVSFNLTTRKNNEIYDKLSEQDIIVKVLPGINAIRISCHIFVSKPDIDRFVSALRKLL
ncbi:MAG: aminotransferase class V-fold PLP-dependent enzyme [Cyclobacteriaceae bacterium]|nr:aminotransferase class V-fold PLP-dependent enzyme [Cyclobacteriaceae bacterium]